MLSGKERIGVNLFRFSILAYSKIMIEIDDVEETGITQFVFPTGQTFGENEERVE